MLGDIVARIVGFSLLNRFRGDDKSKGVFGKATAVAAMTACLWITEVHGGGVPATILDNALSVPYAGFAAVVIIDYLTRLLAFSYGWGAYFPHNDKPTYMESDVRHVNWLADKIYKKYDAGMLNPHDIIRWKTIAMGIRWVIPTVGFSTNFVALAILLSNYWLLACIPALYFVGYIYRYCFEWFDGNKRVAISEYVSGAFLGACYGVV